MSDVDSYTIPLQLDAGVRLGGRWFIGAYFSYGFGGSTSDTLCPTGDCSANTLRFGGQVHWHPLGNVGLDPWVGIGSGYEKVSISSYGRLVRPERVGVRQCPARRGLRALLVGEDWPLCQLLPDPVQLRLGLGLGHRRHAGHRQQDPPRVADDRSPPGHPPLSGRSHGGVAPGSARGDSAGRMPSPPTAPVAQELSLEELWMPFTANRAFKRAPRLLATASGMHYRDVDGRVILDGTAGLWCVNAGPLPAGHRARPSSARRRGSTSRPGFQMGHPASFALAREVAALAPGDLDHVFFANSGSEAVDSALKIALAYHQARGQPERVRFVGRMRGYHGVGFGGISVGGIEPNRKAFAAQLLPHVDHLPHTHDLAAQRLQPRTAGVGGAPGGRAGDDRRRARGADHRRGHRRADGRVDRRAGAAEGLPREAPGDLRRARHPPHLRRGDHRLRAAGDAVRRGLLRASSRTC